MHAFRFDSVETEEDFAEQFKDSAKRYELSEISSVYRFDLVR